MKTKLKVLMDGYGDYWAYYIPEDTFKDAFGDFYTERNVPEQVDEILDTETFMEELEEEAKVFDPVERPKHYNYADGGVECIDYIKQVLGLEGFIAYCRGNVIKYQHRASYKGNTTEDLKKALWYQKEAVQAQEELVEGKG